MPRETSIVRRTLDYLNALEGCVAEKVQGTAFSSGKADINGCYKGRAFRIELKTPDHGNKASKKQVVNLLRWAKAGAATAVAYSLEDVIKVINSLEDTECM